MKVLSCAVRNFRRLESVSIDFESNETVFVGPNNSGKTSTAAAFRCFTGNRDFSIHDVSVSKVPVIDAFGEGDDGQRLPQIELDLWFSIDPEQISFGRAFTLLPELSEDLDKVGISMKYQPKDPLAMRTAFWEAYPEQEGKPRSASLSQFLGADANFSRYYELAYYSLDGRDEKSIKECRLDSREGKALLKDLVRVDFLDAQRSVNDDESSRSSRLSTAFSAFYKSNLDQAKAEESAYQVIDENNKRLTEHYGEHFSGLMSVIKGLGIPSVNDRELKIISSLSPLEALQGNTDLVYVDKARQHELPESYNGLGFKNLIYMAIQISHFHIQWKDTEQNRPLCQLIFIEEPEVHLHAQVQQAFIGNIWEMLAEAAGDGDVPQLVVSTHSSHILDRIDFEKVRYFERCELDGEDRSTVSTFNASRVHSLRNFVPKLVDAGKPVDPEKAKSFLLRYLRLTHCDLFFADAAILIEGSVEKLLLPQMIERSTPELCKKYLSILEVGGAYAHKFEGLLRFLNIPYIVITDLDSVHPEGRHPAVRGDTQGALTSNNTLKTFFGLSTVQELLHLGIEQKECPENARFVAFQTEIVVEDTAGNSLVMIPRTLEEAFAYENFSLLRNGMLNVGISIPTNLGDAYEEIYQRIKSSSFKKTDFALEVLFLESEWTTPRYIEEGLKWLEQRLKHAAQDEEA